jgi:hypothetical protein
MAERPNEEIRGDFGVLISELSPEGWVSLSRLAGDLEFRNGFARSKLEEIVARVRHNLVLEYDMPTEELRRLHNKVLGVTDKANPEVQALAVRLGKNLLENLVSPSENGDPRSYLEPDRVLAHSPCEGPNALDTATSFLYRLEIAVENAPRRVSRRSMESSVQELGEVSRSLIGGEAGLIVQRRAVARSWPIMGISGVRARLERVELATKPVSSSQFETREIFNVALVVPPRV